MKIYTLSGKPKMAGLMEMAVSPKLTTTTAGTTTAIGLGEMFQWIPSDIGRLAALSGFILTCILIYVNLLNAKKTSMEIDRRERDRRTVKFRRNKIVRKHRK